MKAEDLLKQEIERVVGHDLLEAHDFESLSFTLFKSLHESLSPTTLKRLWGYLKNERVQARTHTLDVLARYVGFRNYSDFCEKCVERREERSQVAPFNESGVKEIARVTPNDLKRGQRLVIRWRPDRRIVVKHQGDGHFLVEESEHSKLSVGDTFVCHLMLENEPLYLDKLVHEGMPPRLYVAGQRNGVTIEVET